MTRSPDQVSERVSPTGATRVDAPVFDDVSAIRDATVRPATLSDDVADDLGDVDIDDPGNLDEDDEGWETEDEMEAQAEVDDSELTFAKHSGQCRAPSVVGPSHLIESCKTVFAYPGSVFCVSLDPATNCMAVTGGEDDKAYVWRLTDGEVLLECTGE